MISAMTANLACGGPHNEDTIAAAARWVAAAADEAVDLLFLQECPPRLAEMVADQYQVLEYVPGLLAYRCRSAIAVRRSADLDATARPLPTENYHRSYLAGAEISPRDGKPFLAVSVHASPNPFRHVYEEDWGSPLPEPRPIGADPKLWDADLVLETLRRVATDATPVLAAGDFNEARTYDKPGEPWAVAYFDHAARFGLGDVTYRLWNEERPTRDRLQIDHVLATPSLDKRIRDAEVVTAGPLARTASDHHPLRWTLDGA